MKEPPEKKKQDPIQLPAPMSPSEQVCLDSKNAPLTPLSPNGRAPSEPSVEFGQRPKRRLTSSRTVTQKYPKEKQVKELKARIRGASDPSEREKILDEVLEQFHELQLEYEAIFAKKVQWKDHASKLQELRRGTQRKTQALELQNAELQDRLGALSRGQPIPEQTSAFLISSLFPMTQEIRSQFSEFYNQNRSPMLDYLEEFVEQRRNSVEESWLRGTLLRLWLEIEQTSLEFAESFRRRVLAVLTKKKSNPSNHVVRFLTRYMQDNYLDRDLFPIMGKNLHSAYEFLAGIIDCTARDIERSKLRHYIEELVDFCWTLALSRPEIRLFVPKPGESFSSSFHERFWTSSPNGTKVKEVIWPGLKVLPRKAAASSSSSNSPPPPPANSSHVVLCKVKVLC